MAGLDKTIGAILLGLVVGSILFGLTTLQTHMYFQRYQNDNAWIKYFVGAIWIFDAIHVALCTHAIYYYLITHFGDNVALQVEVWSMALQTMCNTIIGVAVQLFFARRVYKLSRNKVLTSIIATSAAIHLSLGIYFTTEVFVLKEFAKFKALIWVTCVGLGNAAMADIIIAIALVQWLRGVRTGITKTDNMISTLIIYAVNTGAITSLVATICVLCFALMPTNLIWLGFYWILCKLYANSLLANLNNREALRNKVTTSESKGTVVLPLGNMTSSNRHRFARPQHQQEPLKINVTTETMIAHGREGSPPPSTTSIDKSTGPNAMPRFAEMTSSEKALG